MGNRMTKLQLTINTGTDTDAQELSELTRQLRQEISALDVEEVGLLRGEKIPEGAKAGDPITWGTLLVTLVASGGVLPTLINAIQSWLTQHATRSITLKIGDDQLDVKGVSSEEQRQLIDLWLKRQMNE